MIRIGVLTPHDAPGPEVEFATMAPPGELGMRVVRVAGTAEAGGGGDSALGTALRALTTPAHLDPAAERLLTDPIDLVGYASTTSAYLIGFDAEHAMIARLEQLTARPAAATCAAAVHALHVMGVRRVALIGAPWFEPEFNRLGADYFAGQGFDVVSSRSADLSHDPSQIEPAAVADWAAHNVDAAAEAIFIGGNGFRAVGAIEELEAAINRPVLTANQVLLWQLLAHADTRFTITGYGQLFTYRP